MRKRLHLVLLLVLAMSLFLAACGDNTATPVSSGTATPAAKTTIAAGTTAATTTSAGATTTAATSGDAFALKPQQTFKPLDSKAQKGGKLTTISLAKLAPSLHPYPTDSDYTDSWQEVAQLIFAMPLANFSYNSLNFELAAAKDLKVSTDTKVFTFTLRNDLKWSDGSAVTVDDYQFAYDNAIKEDKTNPNNNFVGLDDLKRITSFKTDSATNNITVTLDDVYPSQLALAFATQVLPVPKKVWDGKSWRDATQNKEILKPTVVSGPYVVDSYDSNSEAVLKPNPYYYRGVTNFDNIVLKGGDATIVLQAVKTGLADWAYSIPSSQFNEAKSDSSINAFTWEAVNQAFRYIEYNTKRTPMDDKAFRQAINYAVDRTSIGKLAEAGLGIPQFSFLSTLSPYYNKNVNEYKYNLATAKKTLTDAGYKLDGGKLLDKSGKPIELTVAYPTSSQARAIIATYLQQQLKELGITLKIDGKEFSAFTQQLGARDFDISLSSSGGGFPDPDTLKSFFRTDGTQNHTGYVNPKIDELFAQGSKELNIEKRKEIYNQIQQILVDDAPMYFMYGYNTPTAMSKKVLGVVPNKGDKLYYDDGMTRWYYAAS